MIELSRSYVRFGAFKNKGLKKFLTFSLSLLLISPFFSFYPDFQQSSEEEDFLYASKLYNDGLYDLAIAQLNQFINLYPNSIRILDAKYMVGMSYFKLDNLDEARKIFQRIDIDHPGTRRGEMSLFMVGVIYDKMGEHILAGETFKRMALFYPSSPEAPEAYFKAGESYKKAGNLDKAVEVFNELISRYPDLDQSIKGRLELSRIYRGQKKFKFSLSELDRVSVHPLFEKFMIDIFIERAETYTAMGDLESARKILTDLTDKFKPVDEAIQGYFKLGEIYISLGDYKTAEKYFSQVLKNSTDEALLNRTYVRYGDISFLEGKYDRALKYYLKSSIEKIETPEDYINLLKEGLCYEELEEDDKALKIYNRLALSEISIGREFRLEATERAAELNLAMRDFRSAISLYRNYIEKFADRREASNFYFEIGRIFEFQLKDYRKAILYYRNVAKDTLKSIKADDAMASTGRCYFKLGEYSSSVNEFRELLRRFPGSEYTEYAGKMIDFQKKFYIQRAELEFNRLAQLLGDIIAERPRDELYFELAMTYYNDLKDYNRASEHLERLLKLNPGEDVKLRTLYFLGSSYKNLAEKAEFFGDRDARRNYEKSAYSVFKSLLKNFPESDYADEAAISLAEIEIGRETDEKVKIQKKKSLFKTILITYPGSNKMDYMLYELGNIYKSYSQEPESLKIAAGYLSLIESNFQSSPFIDKAVYEKILINSRLMDDFPLTSELSNFIRKFPSSEMVVKAKYSLSRALRKSQKFEEALQLLVDIKNNHYYSEYADSVKVLIGDLYLAVGRYVDALDIFIDFIEPSDFLSRAFKRSVTPADPELFYKIAYVYDRLGQNEDAIDYYSRFLEIAQERELILKSILALKDIYVRTGDFDTAREVLRKYIAMNPDREEELKFRKELAEIYFSTEDYNLAIEEYNKILKLTEDPAERKYILSRKIVSHFRIKDIDNANKSIEKFIYAFKKEYIDTYKAMFFFERGKYYSAEKDFTRALKIFQKIIDDYEGTEFVVPSMYETAKIYVVTNRIDEAIDLLTRMTIRYKGHSIIPQVYNTLGGIYFSSEQFQNAISAFKKAVEDPNAGPILKDAMANLIRCYEVLGIWDSAIALAKEYIRRFPDAEDVFVMRIKVGNYLMNISEYERAIEYFKELIVHADPETSAEIQYWIGENYFKMGEYAKAIREYLKVPYMGKPTRLDWSASALWKVGNAYEKLDNYDKAVFMYKKIIEERGAASNFGRFARKRIDELILSGKISSESGK